MSDEKRKCDCCGTYVSKEEICKECDLCEECCDCEQE